MHDAPEETRLRLRTKYKHEMDKHLSILRDKLPALANEPQNREVLDAFFLSVHTIRGNIGMMSLIMTTSPELNAIAIEMEHTALALTKGEIAPIPEVLANFYHGIEKIELSLAA